MEVLSPVMKNKITRLILKRGHKNIPFFIEDLVMFYTESKITFAVDKNNNKYICDKNLSELEVILDEKVFFRANRQHIININFISSYQSFQKVKIHIEVSIAADNYDVYVSQVTVGEFKKWILNE
jgi:DNA-binding LytR/AlgR family response regulator